MFLILCICDLVVGSGYFLVLAFNEMVWVVYELGFIVFLYCYDFKLENDEIIIYYMLMGEIFNYIKLDSENDFYYYI